MAINPDILNELCGDIGQWTDNDQVNAVSAVNPAGRFEFACNTHDTGNLADRFRTILSPPNQFTLEVVTYFDLIGAIGTNNFARLSYGTATWEFRVLFYSDGVVILKTGGGYTNIGNLAKTGAEAVDQTWRFQIDKSAGEASATVEVFLDNVSQGTFDCDYEVSYNNGRIRWMQYGYTLDDAMSHLDHVRIGTGLGEITTTMALLTGVVVVKNSDDVYIRTSFDSTYDLLEKIDLTYSYNAIIGFYLLSLINRYALNSNIVATDGQGISVKGELDDASPLYYNSTYIGAGHGASRMLSVSSPGHGKTNVDVGSEWKDASNRKWYILKIVDIDTLWVISENLTPSASWTFDISIDGATLTHSANATNTGDITVSSSTLTQLTPGVKLDEKYISLNGNVSIIADGVYTGDFLIIENNYRISSVSSILNYIIDRVGSATAPDFQDEAIDDDSGVHITYRFNDNGSCVVDHDVSFYNDVTLGAISGVQSIAPVVPAGGTSHLYMPRVLPISDGVTTYDFRDVESVPVWPAALNAQLEFTSTYLEDTDAPTDRVVAFSKDSGGNKYYNFGFLIGVASDYQDGRDITRSVSIDDAIMISTASKTYVRSAGASSWWPSGLVPSGTDFTVRTYRCPINFGLDTDATCIAWFETEDAIYLVLDYHANVDKTLSLPAAWTGKLISIINQSATFSVTDTVVSASGLPITVTDDYGYAVLKLEDSDMSNALTFETIYQTVMKAIGDSAYSRSDEVKSICNMVYLNEILTCDDLYPLHWLLKCDDTRKTKAPITITGISEANPCVVTAAAHVLVTGDVETFYDIVGMTELNFRTCRVLRINADTFSLQELDGTAISSVGFTSWSSGGKGLYRGTTINECRRVVTANIHGYNKGLSRVSMQEIEASAAWMDASPSRPSRYTYIKEFKSDGTPYDYLMLYRGADAAYNLRVWYERNPDRLVDTTDVPFLPHQFHDAVVAGAIVRLGESKVQVEAGMVWPAIYERHLNAIKTMNRQWWHEHGEEVQRSGLFLA